MKTKWFMAMLLAAMLVPTGGCFFLVVGAAAGAGTVVYVNGELKESEGVPYDRVYEATVAALTEMQFNVISKQKDAATAVVTARTSTDKKITVTLNKQSATATEIRIRVGTVGDKDLSQQILDKIKSRF